MQKPPVTQAEIARRTGLAQMTVSQALSGKGRLSDETRARVLAMAAELGYRPNGLARRVQEGRCRGLALLGSAVRQSYNIAEQDFHMAVGAALAERSWHLTEAWLPSDGLADPATVADLLDRLLADAVLVHDVGPQPPAVESLLERHHVPAVWVNTGRAQDGVDFADAAGAQAGLRHLLAQGYRRPALLLTMDPDRADAHISQRERTRGWRAACAEAGIPARICHPPATPDRFAIFGYTAQLLASPDRPDAVFGYAWRTACVVRTVAGERGLRLGRDLGLVAFAQRHETLFDGPLTFCHLDYAALGRESVAMAWRRLESGRSQPQVLIPVTVENPGATTDRSV